MLPEIQHHSVHWVDGMKITQKHFLESENYLNDQVRDVALRQMPSYGYGLLPGGTGSVKSLELLISPDPNQRILVKLLSCRASTPNGNRIEILKETPKEVTLSLSEIFSTQNLSPAREYSFDLLLSVNPFARTAFGEPSLEEFPPRHPFSRPSYQLGLVPTGQLGEDLSGASHLVIGRLLYTNGELRPDSRYIPACMAVNSHPLLLDWYHQMGNLLSETQTSSFRIIQKIKSRNQRNSLTDSVYYLTEKLVFALSDGEFRYQAMLLQQPPLVLVEHLVKAARLIRTVLDCLTDKDREELLGYMAEWSEISPGAIENKLNEAIYLQYNHQETGRTITPLDDFFRMLSSLLNKLSQLEFIGKRKGQAVFIIENPVNDPPSDKLKPRWSPLS